MGSGKILRQNASYMWKVGGRLEMSHGEPAVKDQFKRLTWKESNVAKTAEADPPLPTDCPYAGARPMLGMQYIRFCDATPMNRWACPKSVYAVKAVFEGCTVKTKKDAESSHGKK